MRLLKAFVAKSFSPQDKVKNEMIEAILDQFKPLGLLRTTAEPFEVESVSRKVREKIDGCDLFICILTRRHQIANSSGIQGSEVTWTAAPWLYQESGYALKADKKLLLLFEDGVERPALQGDLVAPEPPSLRHESVALPSKLWPNQNTCVGSNRASRRGIHGESNKNFRTSFTGRGDRNVSSPI
jgi:hypothetical protein